MKKENNKKNINKNENAQLLNILCTMRLQVLIIIEPSLKSNANKGYPLIM